MFAAALASVKTRIDAVFATAMWGAIAGIAALVAVSFLLAALFIWIRDAYTPITACVVLAIIFALIAGMAGLMIVIVKRRRERVTQERAQQFAGQAASVGINLGEKLRAVPPRYLVLGAFAAGLLASLSRTERR